MYSEYWYSLGGSAVFQAGFRKKWIHSLLLWDESVPGESNQCLYIIRLNKNPKNKNENPSPSKLILSPATISAEVRAPAAEILNNSPPELNARCLLGGPPILCTESRAAPQSVVERGRAGGCISVRYAS